jgi:hypothetical protein
LSKICKAPALPTNTVILREASNCLLSCPSIVPVYARVPSDLIDTHTGSDAVNATRMATGKPSGFPAVSFGWADSGGLPGTRMVPLSATSAGMKYVFSESAFIDSADTAGTLGCRLAGSATRGAGSAKRDAG